MAKGLQILCILSSLLSVGRGFQCYDCEYLASGDGVPTAVYCEDTFNAQEYGGEVVECQTQCFKYKMKESSGRYITRRGCFSSALNLGDTCREGSADSEDLKINLNCCSSESEPCNGSVTAYILLYLLSFCFMFHML